MNIDEWDGMAFFGVGGWKGLKMVWDEMNTCIVIPWVVV